MLCQQICCFHELFISYTFVLSINFVFIKFSKFCQYQALKLNKPLILFLILVTHIKAFHMIYHTLWYLVSTWRYKALKIRHAQVIFKTTYVKIRGQSKGHTKVKCISNDGVYSS